MSNFLLKLASVFSPQSVRARVLREIAQTERSLFDSDRSLEYAEAAVGLYVGRLAHLRAALIVIDYNNNNKSGEVVQIAGL